MKKYGVILAGIFLWITSGMVLADDGIEGKISAIDLAGRTIEISGVRIDVKGAEIEDLKDRRIALKDLQVGDWVEVEGAFNQDGTFSAEEVEMKHTRAAELSGHVDRVDADKKCLMVNGITVTTSKDTILEGDDDRPMTFDQIKPGSEVECRGRWTGHKTLAADKIELD